ESCKPESCKPESCKPESCKPESCKPESCKPESCKPESCKPESCKQIFANPSLAEHEARRSEPRCVNIPPPPPCFLPGWPSPTPTRACGRSTTFLSTRSNRLTD